MEIQLKDNETCCLYPPQIKKILPITIFFFQKKKFVIHITTLFQSTLHRDLSRKETGSLHGDLS